MTAQAGGTALRLRKLRLRRELRAKRASISKASRQLAAAKAARAAGRLLRCRRHIAVYLSRRDELDTAPLVQVLARSGHCLYAPKLRAQRLIFVALKSRAALRRNRFGIREPLAAARAIRLDAIVLPLLGFDAAGRRLGQGGGFYDRALTRHRRVLRVGFAFAVQEAGAIPVNEHDAQLDAVVTELGIRRFKQTQ